MEIINFLDGRFKYDDDGQFIWLVDSEGKLQKIADLRGWGAIQNLFKGDKGIIDSDKASKFQDSIGEWIVNALNSKLEEEKKTWTRFIDKYPSEPKKIVARHLNTPDIIGEAHYFNIDSPNTRMTNLNNFEWSYVVEKENISDVVVEKTNQSDVISWVAFDWNKLETRPKKYGKYLICRKDGKVHWETWNGSGWAYNHNEIRYWAVIVPPSPNL